MMLQPTEQNELPAKVISSFLNPLLPGFHIYFSIETDLLNFQG